MTWLRQLLEDEGDQEPAEFLESLKVDLFEDEVFVFTPKGEVKNLSAGSTPLDFAYAVHTDVGHRCVGAKVNGKIVPLHYQLKSGDIVEVLTSKQERGPSRDWLALVRTSRARNKIRAALTRERREDAERRGREELQEALRKQGLPPQRIAGSPLLADVIREMGFRKADDFYVALGGAKISARTVVNKIMQRLKAGEAVAGDETESRLAGVLEGRDERQRRTQEASDYGIVVQGIDDVMVRLAKCCRPVPGDDDRGLRLARPGDHDPPGGLQEREGADEGAGALHRRRLGGGQRRLLPRRARDRRLGPPAPARGSLADLRRDRRQHRRGTLLDQAPDGEEPLRGRGRRLGAAAPVRLAAPPRGLGLRRLPRHADGLMRVRGARSRWIAGLVGAGLLLAANEAVASELRFAPDSFGNGPFVQYRAADGEFNRVRLASQQLTPESARVTLRDSGAGAMTAASAQTEASCTFLPSAARCEAPQAAFYRVWLWLGDGDDRARVPDTAEFGAHVMGGPGSDRVTGLAPVDLFRGGAGDDTFHGWTGPGQADETDFVEAGRGDDVIVAGKSDLHVWAGRGGDEILGSNAPTDLIRAQRGRDLIDAADGGRDVVGCGPGEDRAIVDAIDAVSEACERVRVLED